MKLRLWDIFVVLCVVIGAALFAMIVFFDPIKDYLGRSNTLYAAHFSNAAFSQISIGTPRTRVLDLLGPPLKTQINQQYPVWALRDESTRTRYGLDHFIDMEILWYSRPKNSREDYEMVDVALGPDATVISTAKWVTD